MKRAEIKENRKAIRRVSGGKGALNSPKATEKQAEAAGARAQKLAAKRVRRQAKFEQR